MIQISVSKIDEVINLEDEYSHRNIFKTNLIESISKTLCVPKEKSLSEVRFLEFQDLSSFLTHLKTNSVNRYYCIDRRLDGADEDNRDGDKAIEFIHQKEENPFIYVLTAYSDTLPYGDKQIRKKTDAWRVVTDEIATRIALNRKNNKMNIVMPDTITLMEDIPARIEEIKENSIVLAEFKGETIQYQEFPKTKFLHLSDKELVIGRILSIETYDDHQGHTIIQINTGICRSFESKPYLRYKYFKELPDYQIHDFIFSPSFGYDKDSDNSK
jgi:hypothetical protein